MSKKIILKKAVSLTLALALVVPSVLGSIGMVTANAAEPEPEPSNSGTVGEMVSNDVGQTTTEYLSDNMKASKEKQADAMSDEYWDEEAPADVEEAAEMYLEDTTDGKIKADNSGADEESASLDDLNVTAAEKKYDENGLRETAHYVRVTYTIANKQYLKVNTIDDLFKKNTDAFLGSMVSTSRVYETDDNKDCYVAFLNYGALNDLSNKIIDADFVTNVQTNPKNVENDVVFDKNTGIVYIPKSYYFATDGTEIGYDLQAQILIAPELNADITVNVTAENHSSAKLAMGNGQMSFTAYNSMTFPLFTKETANKVSFDDIQVYVNDSANPLDLTEESGATYDPSTGEYTLNQVASTIYSVRFVIGGKSLASRIADFVSPVMVASAKAVTNGADMTFVKNVSTGELVTPTIEIDKLKAGYTYEYKVATTGLKADAVAAMLDAGQDDFIYAPLLPKAPTDGHDIRVQFYDDVTADGDKSASLNKVIEHAKSLVPAEEQEADTLHGEGPGGDGNRWWYKFVLDAPEGVLNEVHGNGDAYWGEESEWKWSNTFQYDGKVNYRHFYAGMCCHVGEDLLVQEFKSKNQVSVLEKGDGYLILGLAQTAGSTKLDAQAGACIIKINTKRELGLQKVSSNTSVSEDNNCYSLKGAEYGVYKNIADGKLRDKVATLITDEKGNTNVESLEAGIYYIREDKPPKGFTNDIDPATGEVRYYKVDIREKDQVLKVSDKPGTDPLRLLLNKVDQETKGMALGAGLLAGAQYTINYYDGYYSTEAELANVKPKRSWTIETQEVDGKGVAYLLDEFLVDGSDPLYYDEDKNVVIPLGTITIKEKEASKGYMVDGSYIESYDGRQNTTQHGELLISQIKLDLTTNITAVEIGHDFTSYEPVKRGDFKFVKTDEETQKTMPYIPFRITSQTTGESHIIVTDENGNFSTSSSKNPHDQNTNANDNVTDGNYDPDAGIWFGQYKDADGQIKITPPINDRGALPFDTYDVEEIPCERNEGKAMYKGEFTISKDNQDPTLGDVENPDLLLRTTAINEATGTHYAQAKDHVMIIDTVEYWGLNKDKGTEYQLVGTLMNKSTGEPVLDADGNPVTVEKMFVAPTAEGHEEMEFVFDATGFEGQDVVVFEELYVDNKLFTSHKDLEDESQTIHFPEIGTEAEDATTQSNVTRAAEDITIKDIVSYKNLKPNVTYKIKGTLMEKVYKDPAYEEIHEGDELYDENGNLIDEDGNLIDEDGNLIDENGNIIDDEDVVIDGEESEMEEYSTDDTEERSFELASIDDEEDSSDEGEAEPAALSDEIDTIDETSGDVSVEIGDEEDTENPDGDEVSGEDEEVVDGSESGEDEETGEYTYQPALDDNGNEITTEVEFVPDESEGQTEVTFTFSGVNVAGKTLVAFEELYYKDALLAVHADIEDEAQTIYVPLVETEAKDAENNTHTSLADGQITIIDTVKYQNLFPGKEYKVNGVLMDKSTKEPLMVGGLEIKAETVFVAEAESGEVELSFTFDGSALEGKTLVAFETLTQTDIDKVVGTHEDIDDEDQSVHVPYIKTTAKDKKDGDHKVAGVKKTVVIDKVSYRNLVPGKTYKVTGTLMNKGSKKALLINGKEVTGEKTFKATASNGYVEVKFKFNGSKLKRGKKLVAFEKLYDAGSNAEIARHEDIKDKAQTVKIVDKEEDESSGSRRSGGSGGSGGSGYGSVQTGDTMRLYILLGGGAILILAGAVLFFRKKRS